MKKIYLTLLILSILGTAPVIAQVALPGSGAGDSTRGQQVAGESAQRNQIDRMPGPPSPKYPIRSSASWEKAKAEAFRKNVLATLKEEELTVDKVIDGDTFEVANNNYRLTFRVVGIDAPEEGQENWKEAKDRLAEMILGKKVLIKYSTFYPRHANGVFIVRVFVDKNDVGSLMLNNGWAWYDKNYGVFFEKKEDEENIQSMKNARAAKSGIWKSGKIQEPWEYFEKTQKGKSKSF